MFYKGLNTLTGVSGFDDEARIALGLADPWRGIVVIGVEAAVVIGVEMR
jgi:hypothetical protein